MNGFSGSYSPDDVVFLLKAVDLAPTPVEDKERLIQSGAKHYSEIIAPESVPGPEYFAHFEAAFARNVGRLAHDVVSLTKALNEAHPEPFVLASLARAGTPIGILLRRALRRLGRDVPHYSVSIIRDRGIDHVALDAIRERHPGATIRFVDGWTGKGAIARELTRALDEYRDSRGVALDPMVVVLADLAGVAGLAASGDDYLIPSAILNAVVSGLVSRTILNDDVVQPGDFHACVHYTEMAAADRSQWFVDTVDVHIEEALDTARTATWTKTDRDARYAVSSAFVEDVLTRYELTDKNRVKPGIGEATRALLRRVPDRVLLPEPDAEDVAHLVHLARAKSVPIDVWPDMPYRATTIIRRLGNKHRAWT